MNGIFHRNHQSNNNPRYEISTNVILPALTNYIMRAKSLAALIRNESANYAAVSNTPDLFELSAENMGSLAFIIDPILDDLRQHETIYLVTVSCSIHRWQTHIRDETLPNIISIAETKSGHEEMDVVYDNNVSSASTTPLPDGLMKAVSRREDSVSNLCRIQQDKNSNSTSLQSEIAVESSTSAQSRLGNVDGFIRAAAQGLFLIVGLIHYHSLSAWLQ